MHFRFSRKTLWIGAIAAVFSVAGAAMIPDFYARLGIPDHDQRWDSLPNDGNMYCVPTSFYNVIEYMRTHGVPEMPNYSTLGTDGALAVLGLLFTTHPLTGTAGGPKHSLMVGWLGESSDPLVFGYSYGPDWDWGTYRIRQAIASGSAVVLGYGKYKRLDPESYEMSRIGGHSVTLKGYEFRNEDDILFIRDPARDDGNLFAQSPFADFTPTVKNGTLLSVDYGEVIHARYASSNDGVFRYVDSMHQYMPAMGGWSNNQFFSSSPASLRTPSPSNKNIVVKMPFQFTPDSGDEALPDTYEIQPREEVVDWVLDLGSLTVVYVTKLGRVFEVDLTDDRHHKLLHVIKGAKQVMIGGTSMDIYVLGDGSVKPGDGSVLPGDGSVRFGDGSVRVVRIERDDNSAEQIVLPFKAVAMEYDPTTGGPALFVDTLDWMVSLDEDLRNPIAQPLDALPAGAGAPIFRINPESGDVLYTREGASGYFKAFRGTGRSVFSELPGVSDIRSLVPVRANTIIVQDGFSLKTIDGNGNRSPSQFDGLTGVTGTFKMNRSHIAAKPGYDSGPGWHNIPPDQLDD
jgi:hypothetical protein